MDASLDLAFMYADFGETVTVNGSSVTAIFDGGDIDPGGLAVASTEPSLRCIASDVASAVMDQTVVRAGVTYKIRDLKPIGPDELETRLILEQQ